MDNHVTYIQTDAYRTNTCDTVWWGYPSMIDDLLDYHCIAIIYTTTRFWFLRQQQIHELKHFLLYSVVFTMITV